MNSRDDIRFRYVNNIRYYIGHVESVDEDYVVTFSIPNMLENLSKYPSAYPKITDHVKEVKIGDSILVEQLDMSTQFFTYTPINKNNNTGLYFGDCKVDITNGKTIKIETDDLKLILDKSEGKGKIYFGNDFYSLNQFIEDLKIALSTLHTEGSLTNHVGTAWYSQTLADKFLKLQEILPISFNDD